MLRYFLQKLIFTSVIMIINVIRTFWDEFLFENMRIYMSLSIFQGHFYYLERILFYNYVKIWLILFNFYKDVKILIWKKNILKFLWKFYINVYIEKVFFTKMKKFHKKSKILTKFVKFLYMKFLHMQNLWVRLNQDCMILVLIF